MHTHVCAFIFKRTSPNRFYSQDSREARHTSTICTGCSQLSFTPFWVSDRLILRGSDPYQQGADPIHDSSVSEVGGGVHSAGGFVMLEVGSSVNPWITMVTEAISALSFGCKRALFSSWVLCSGHRDDLFRCSLLFLVSTYVPFKNMQVINMQSFSCLWSYI